MNMLDSLSVEHALGKRVGLHLRIARRCGAVLGHMVRGMFTFTASRDRNFAGKERVRPLL